MCGGGAGAGSHWQNTGWRRVPGSTEGWAAIAQTQEQELHLKEHSKSAEKEYGH